jgi:DNA-binding NtrC family response regulator
VRVPNPAALLVEHPAVPVPGIGRAIVTSRPAGDLVTAGSLSRSDRFRMALQLTAAAAVLGEFDLWPGRASIRNALFVRTSSGLQAQMAHFPMPMSRVFSRLGGGEAAALMTRDAVIAAVAEVVGLPSSAIDTRSGAPGFFLEGAIMRQLRELKKPLDTCTARALWAFRWDGLPVPAEGETSYWRVPEHDLARRMAVALWATVRRSGGEAWLSDSGDAEEETEPVPALGSSGTLIVAGEVSVGEIAAVTRWAERAGCSAVVVGTFPRGWHPPSPPGFKSRNLMQHLAIAGLPLEEARRVIERRQGRIDPLDPIEKQTLTEAARWVFGSPSRRRSGTKPDARRTAIENLLGLSPDGLPPGFVSIHSGVPIERIEVLQSRLPVIVNAGWWRLAEPVPLEPDPLHSEIAVLFKPGDPRRLLHEALGTGDSVDLEGWARSKLDLLDGLAVRDVLSSILPGSLGIGITTLLAEACLSVLDLAGARCALQAIPSDRGLALSTWADNLDPEPGSRRSLVRAEDTQANQRAIVEATLLVANELRRHDGSKSQEIRSIIDHGLTSMPPKLRRRFEIELAWLENPEYFDDPGWRRRVATRHRSLRTQLAHRRALVFMARGQPRSARRLLRTLLDDRMGPGLQGVIEQDLGAAALDEGRSRDAEGHQLRAYRLLQAAGFRHVTRDVLFNLAVAEIDLLEVVRAGQRLKQLADEDPTDLFVIGEMARLALATGDRGSFKRGLEAFETRARGDGRFAEGLHLLCGVRALFDGDHSRAEGEFDAAGQEGVAWSELVGSLAGRPPSAVEPDGWGVTTAAEAVRSFRFGDRSRLDRFNAGHMTRQLAFGLALAEHVGGMILPLSAATRSRAAGILREAGMDGWGWALAGSGADAEDAMEAITEIVERGGPDGLDTDLTRRLLKGLGVDGLELREASDGRLLWRAGTGTPGPEIRRRRFVLVPLGNEAREDSAWRLLTAVLEVFAPIPPRSPDPEVGKTGFFGVSSAAQAIRRELCELGPTHLPILLVGETGVGKEVAAQALHRLSGRRGAFVAVNVAAIPGNLLEAELFGSVKGAFTGADRSRQGLVMAADGGTLFLDEIGDLDRPLQVKLLRFLESQEFRAIGSTRATVVDVRIVSATNRDLGRGVRDGTFRQDLYYRIAASPFVIPPLRERREDIGLLRDLFQQKATAEHGLAPCTWSNQADAALRAYRWPGNVRELRQTVEVAMVRAAGAVVRLDHLAIQGVERPETGTWAEAQDAFRSRYLRTALERNEGNRSATARDLGISRQALLYHLRNLGLMDL